MKLWVDDERPITAEWGVSIFHVHAKTSTNAIHWLDTYRRKNIARGRDQNHMIDEISLDHDLGGEETGMKVLDYMIKHDIWPKTLTIHTANPPARQQMLRAANAEAPVWVDIYVKTW